MVLAETLDLLLDHLYPEVRDGTCLAAVHVWHLWPPLELDRWDANSLPILRDEDLDCLRAHVVDEPRQSVHVRREAALLGRLSRDAVRA